MASVSVRERPTADLPSTLRHPAFLEYGRPSEELQPLEPLDKARLIVQLEELLDSGKLQGEKQANVQRFLEELKAGQKSVQFAKIYEIAKKLEQPVEVTLDSEVAAALKKGRARELQLNGTAYVEYVAGNRDSLQSLSNAQTKKSEATAVTALRPGEDRLFHMHMHYLTEKEKAALERTEVLLEPFHPELHSTQGSKVLREVRFEPAATDEDVREVRRKFEEVTFQTPQPTPHKPASLGRKPVSGLASRSRVECAVHSPEAAQSRPKSPFVLEVKERTWHKQSHLHARNRRPKSATHLGRDARASELVPHRVDERMEELWDLRDVNTDFEERLVCSKKDCGPCWGGHLHEACSHPQQPLWRRTDLLAKTSTYVPLSPHEQRLLSEGKILHCHYRHNFEKVNISRYIHHTLQDLGKEKQQRALEEAKRKQQREGFALLNAKIKADNMKLKRKKFDLPVNKRFAVGIAAAPKDKPKVAPEDRIKLRPQDKSYLKPKRPVSADNAFQGGENISTYFLRRHIDTLRAEKLRLRQEAEEKKRQAEERRKRRKELREAHGIPEAARPKKRVERFGRSKYRAELEAEAKRRREAEAKRKYQARSVELKRKMQLSRAKKRPFRGEDGYVFRTDLDPEQPHRVDSLAADETKARLASHQQARVFEQAEEFRLLNEHQQASTARRVTFVDPAEDAEYPLIEYPRPPSLEARERVRLLDVERGMLTEINEAVQQGAAAQLQSRSLEHRAYRKTINDHLTLDVQEAQEHEYFGLRPNPNFRHVDTRHVPGPPKKNVRPTVVTVKKTAKPGDKPPGMPHDFGNMKIDTYSYTSKLPLAPAAAVKMKQSTRPPVIAKKPPPQKGRRYKTKISVPGQTLEKHIATSVYLKAGQSQAALGSAQTQAAQQAVTFGQQQLESGAAEQYEIDEYIFKRATPLDDKVARNANFRPHQQLSLVDKVARKIEAEPSDEELLQFEARDVHTDDADFDEIFNAPAEKLLKKKVLMLK